MARLIGIDWGTSSFRAYLIGAAGDVQAELATDDGITQIEAGRFRDVFHQHVGDWLAAHPEAPILLSGMIGSRNGWREAPYVATPAGAGELASALTALDVGAGRTAHLVPGLNIDQPKANPDVMRGEETQIIGSTAAELPHAVVVAPGSHTKWVALTDGVITRFTTFMTGEVFHALAKHTILRALARDGGDDTEAFRRGLERFADTSVHRELLSEIFSARTLPLAGRMTDTAVADYLSGLIIGAELRHGLALYDAQTVHLIGRSDLALRYCTAFEVFGRRVQIERDGAAARGQYRIAQMAGLI